MNRLSRVFSKKKVLMSYLIPTSKQVGKFVKLASAYIDSGVDILEIGFPSKIPWLDGPLIQNLHVKAVKNRVTANIIFRAVKKIRADFPNTPLIVMGYFSSINEYGINEFVKKAAEVGFDGFLIPDYPAHLDPLGLLTIMKKRQIHNIVFLDGLSLSRKKEKEYRIFKTLMENSQGFIYLQSRLGTSGKNGLINLEELRIAIKRVKKYSDGVPVIVGFGISEKEVVEKIISIGADGVVVSSALLKILYTRGINDVVKAIKEIKGVM